MFLALTGHAAEEKPERGRRKRHRGEGGMTATSDDRAGPGAARGLGQAINDSLLIGWRNLKRIPRIPELAIFAILQSIMFVLLFVFVFGGAIPIPGGATTRPS